MRRLAVIAAFVASLAGVGQAAAQDLPCGLPGSRPVWVEFADGSVDFRQALFGKPGEIVATNGVPRAAEMRSLGAQTVYWHMSLKGIVGKPNTPRDTADTQARASALFDKAVASTGCATPVIILNELHGASAHTPWSTTVTQYRANVLTVFQTLAGRGALPVLLVPGAAQGSRAPWVQGDATAWWQQIASLGDIVREMHFNAPYISRRGPVIGARMRRVAMRAAIGQLTAIGIPPDRLGLMLGFQSGPGKGGREGLEPTSEWLRIVKQDTLAAKQVSAELGTTFVVTWGWGTFAFAPAGADPDKPAAACVYLWTRAQSLCDGPTAAGPDFDASLTEGQIILPGGAQCTINGTLVSTTAFDQAVALAGGDRNVALAVLLDRVLTAQAGGTATGPDVQAALQAIIRASFSGDPAAFDAELAARDVQSSDVLQAIGDELRRQQADVIADVTQSSSRAARWLRRAQKEALKQTICLNDEVPKRGDFVWSSLLPFLALPTPSLSLEPEAGTVKRGEPVTLNGTVESARASERVTVYARTSGSSVWVAVGDVRARPGNDWSLSVVPEAPRTTYRAVSKSAISNEATVRVKIVKKHHKHHKHHGTKT